MTVSAIDGVSASQVLEQATSRPEALNDLADRFSRMMQQQPAAPVPNETEAGSRSMVSHFIESQEGVMRQTFDKVRAFSLEAPAMNPSELASRQMELTYQLAMVQVQFNAGVYVSQSSKSGLQTLMKNQ
ncbi:type III secretion inner rod protein HrpB2 [Hydrogenophaga palleronii]|uniref:Type III secretion inner rod protein HrpB2 n=1 Tax=Hydrogenophaga palleronii TaxID=65655 RepID=A0ABU1WKY7_9BURK|nr:hypothetical protein [Hydrogenophaga palleronii]MDR7149960.1 type III secretion inner rod protein HrpB2 [Hydrogenophaga palleronii]